MPRPTQEQHDAWDREAAAVDPERVREVVKGPTMCHLVEEACSRRFGISIEAAISVVSRAINRQIVWLHLGDVSLEPVVCSPTNHCARCQELDKRYAP